MEDISVCSVSFNNVAKRGHRGQVGRSGGGQRHEPGVVNQVQVVLPDPVLEALEIEGSVADALHEWVSVLSFPDIGGGFAQQFAEFLHRRFFLRADFSGIFHLGDIINQGNIQLAAGDS